MTEDSDIPDRERLLRFARIMGAGLDADDLVQQALRAVARSDRPAGQQIWSLLTNLLAERAADRYRQVARAQILARHRGLAARPPTRGSHPTTRTAPLWTAQQLVTLLPREILDLLWSRHIGGATWTELATHRRVSPQALKHRVHQALLTARRPSGQSRRGESSLGSPGFTAPRG